MSSTWALLDHWVVDFDGLDDFHIKLKALNEFRAHIKERSHQLRALPFLNEGYWLDIFSRAETTDMHRYTALVSDLDIQGDSSSPDTRGLSLEESWNACAAHVLVDDEAPAWRDPVVFAPRARVHTRWNDEREIELGAGSKRVLVDLDETSSNPYYLGDFDPWQCERTRGGGSDTCARDLPRPPGCEDVAMHAWRPIMDATSDAVTDETTHLYFIPHAGWDPVSITKEDWRRHPLGERHSKEVPRRGVKSGPKDRRGRIWDWDDSHGSHWDVQHESDHDHSYMNVQPDGRIKKR